MEGKNVQNKKFQLCKQKKLTKILKNQIFGKKNTISKKKNFDKTSKFW